MRAIRAVKVLKIAVLGTAAIGVAGYVVMSLWNWLGPEVFGFRVIGFWQALGLLALSRILFGCRGGGHAGRWRHRMKARWEGMTPEERERFRGGMAGGCGPVRTEAPV